MNELIYQQGGTLYLDAPLEEQPVSATLTLRTLNNEALSVMTGFDDYEDEACDVDDLRLVLPVTNSGARLFTPNETTGTVGDLTSEPYRLLITRGGRKYWARVAEYDSDGASVCSFRLDQPLPFALVEGDYAYGVRVSSTIDWSAVTSTFTGQVKAIWKVTLSDARIVTIVKLYDVVKQILSQPATWADVLALRPDIETQLSHVANKELLVTKAWEMIKQDLYTLGIRHNLIVPDGSTTLRDTVVMQCLYNLTVHAGLPLPSGYNGLGDAYLDRLKQDRERALSLLQMPIDEDEDGIIAANEKNINRRTVYFRSPYGHRQGS